MIRIASMVGAPDLETPTLAPYGGDLQTAFAKLAALGYEGVELMTKDPARLDGDRIHRWLDEHGLRMVGLCSGHVFGEDGVGLLQHDLTINNAAAARLRDFIDFAATYFGPGTLVNIGRSRGVGDPARPEQTMETAAGALRELAEYARPRGIGLVLEPISRQEVNFIHSTQDGLVLARLVNHPNFGLMTDTYHMYYEDADLHASFREAAPLIWHVHFSDSNRCWPGSGDIDYEAVVRTLRETNYSGFVSMEIMVWPDAETAASAGIRHIRQFIPKT